MAIGLLAVIAATWVHYVTANSAACLNFPPENWCKDGNFKNVVAGHTEAWVCLNKPAVVLFPGEANLCSNWLLVEPVRLVERAACSQYWTEVYPDRPPLCTIEQARRVFHEAVLTDSSTLTKGPGEFSSWNGANSTIFQWDCALATTKSDVQFTVTAYFTDDKTKDSFSDMRVTKGSLVLNYDLVWPSDPNTIKDNRQVDLYVNVTAYNEACGPLYPLSYGAANLTTEKDTFTPMVRADVYPANGVALWNACPFSRRGNTFFMILPNGPDDLWDGDIPYLTNLGTVGKGLLDIERQYTRSSFLLPLNNSELMLEQIYSNSYLVVPFGVTIIIGISGVAFVSALLVALVVFIGRYNRLSKTLPQGGYQYREIPR